MAKSSLAWTDRPRMSREVPMRMTFWVWPPLLGSNQSTMPSYIPVREKDCPENANEPVLRLAYRHPVRLRIFLIPE